MRSFTPLFLALGALSLGAHARVVGAQQASAPPGWSWHLDAPGKLVLDSTFRMSDSTFQVVLMPPGWHVTAGPAMSALDPSYRAEGRFALESEIFVFPSTPEGSEFGVFLGAHALGERDARWTALVVRRDGSAAVLRREGRGTRELSAWKKHEKVAGPTSEGPGRNVLRVQVEAARVTFLVNGERVAELPRATVEPDGAFGLRAGTRANLHVSRLDLVRPLAPPRP